MILSVSRRTDVPNYYSDWFINRLKEGFLYVRNPMNIHQMEEFIDCVMNGRKPEVTVYDGTKSTQIGFATTEAWKTAGTVICSSDKTPPAASCLEVPVYPVRR